MWWWRTKLWLFELIKHLVPSAQDDVGLQAELKKQNYMYELQMYQLQMHKL